MHCPPGKTVVPGYPHLPAGDPIHALTFGPLEKDPVLEEMLLRAKIQDLNGMRATPRDPQAAALDEIERAVTHPAHVEMEDVPRFLCRAEDVDLVREIVGAEPGRVIEIGAHEKVEFRRLPTLEDRATRTLEYLQAVLHFIPDQPSPAQWAAVKDAVMSVSIPNSRS